ncbi:hypothetical protein [Nakamurella sp.]|uniref:hypothetical protein n=1 Tax=Nakamurella sp. TaxID=1869182 RepID=UPI003B3B19B0
MITESLAPARELTGRAPGGMWWVAWRQHRTLVLAGLGLIVALAVAMVIFRLIYDTRPPGGPDYPADNRFWLWLRLSLLVLPVGLGALGGATVVGPERERGTVLFAVSQSVSRPRWYWTKCAVVTVPLTLGMLALGLVAEWVVTAPGLEPWSPLAVPDFQVIGAVPAILTLLAFGVGVPAGALLRSLAAAMSVALVVGTVLVGALGYGAYLDLVPPVHVVTPSTAPDQAGPVGAYQVGFGYLDAAGQTVAYPACPVQSQTMEAGPPSDPEAWWRQCLVEAGVVASYADYVLADQRTRLTLTLAAIGAAIAAAGLGLGRRRVSRRV